MNIRRSPTIDYTESGQVYRMTVHYGFDTLFAKRHNQSPHFSITAEVFRRMESKEQTYGEETYKHQGRRYILDCVGCMHNQIREHFPDLAPLIPWHLTSLIQPLHYLANGLYWLREMNQTNFESSVVWGAVISDDKESFDKLCADPDYAEAYLNRRLPVVMARFRADMRRRGFRLVFDKDNPLQASMDRLHLALTLEINGDSDPDDIDVLTSAADDVITAFLETQSESERDNDK